MTLMGTSKRKSPTRTEFLFPNKLLIHPRKPPSKKATLRKHYLEKRAQISLDLRLKAEGKALDYCTQALSKSDTVLSFASFGSEISTKEINLFLMKRGSLVLPRVVADSIEVFRVTSLKQLQPSSYGILEPSPTLCSRVKESEIDLSLVPGVAFHSNFHRIGYGKGHYDRFFARFDSSSVEKVGLGYQEQRIEGEFSPQETDIPLDQILLF